MARYRGLSATDYYRAVARETYDKAIFAWVGDLQAGKAPPAHHWAPAEYILRAIGVALAEEGMFGFEEGENAGRKFR